MYYGQCDEYREYSQIWSSKAKEGLGSDFPEKNNVEDLGL